MAENKTDLGKLGDFFCTVSTNMQIFIPVRMGKALGIGANNVVKFSFQKDGQVLFAKSDEASKNEKNAGKKKKEDDAKIKEVLK